jgi:hypothetical protein
MEVCGGKYSAPDLYQVASLITVGDDHIGSVREDLKPYFNMNSFTNEFKLCDIEYTDTQKGVVTKEFDKLYSVLSEDMENPYAERNAEFVKRQFVKMSFECEDIRYDTVIMPLDMKSIWKSLYWKGSYESDTVWTNQVVHGALREMFYYGEVVYEKFRGKVEAVLQACDMVDYTDPLPDFMYQMKRYVRTLHKSNSHKFDWKGKRPNSWDKLPKDVVSVKSTLFARDSRWFLK